MNSCCFQRPLERQFAAIDPWMKCRRIPTRLKKFLTSVGLLETITNALTDPRRPKGQKWSFQYLIRLLFTGALVQTSALKEREGLKKC